MRDVSRRRFLQLAGGGVAATMLSDSIARALAIPANRATRSLRDVEHIVVLTQENRSFDHYFGVMRGVRGFGDPHPVTLPERQAGLVPGRRRRPWSRRSAPARLSDDSLALTFIEDLDHSWDPDASDVQRRQLGPVAADQDHDVHGAHAALGPAVSLRAGRRVHRVRWLLLLRARSDRPQPLLHVDRLGRERRATAAGRSSPTTSSGTAGQTYPERLQAAGISWKIYQDIGDGLDAAAFLGVHVGSVHRQLRRQLAAVLPQLPERGPGQPAVSSGLAPEPTSRSSKRRACSTSSPADVKHGRLPSVSWIAGPRGVHRASGMARRLRRLLHGRSARRADQQPRGVVKDGAADQLGTRTTASSTTSSGPTPTSARSPASRRCRSTTSCSSGTAGTPGGSNGVVGPYGLGVRVPLLAVSPWSRGGWVCSEVFDHTSVIRFIEARFGVDEPNITPWRRAVCGDLTSAFDFESASDRVPKLPERRRLQAGPSNQHPPTFTRCPPAVGSVPTQEPGVRPSRRLGYRFDVAFDADPGTLNLAVKNHGRLGVHLQARSLTVPGAPYSYTIGAGDKLATALPNPGTYDLSLHGPNGFFRHFAGSPDTAVRVDVDTRPPVRPAQAPAPAHRPWRPPPPAGRRRCRRRLRSRPADRGARHEEITIDTRHSGGWYDIALSTPSDTSFSYQLAGRLESGETVDQRPATRPITRQHSAIQARGATKRTALDPSSIHEALWSS